MSIAVFPGSFDPVTTGHMDLIYRSTRLFDQVIIGILQNIGKTPLFSVKERVEMLEELTKDFDKVRVTSFDGLLVDFVQQEHADVIVRGLRNSQDFQYELPLAQGNYKLNQHADTVFLATAPEHSYISSSAVKEILRFGGDISDFVPTLVSQRIQDR